MSLMDCDVNAKLRAQAHLESIVDAWKRLQETIPRGSEKWNELGADREVYVELIKILHGGA